MEGFETACHKLGIKLFLFLTRFPELNGHVERA